MQSEGGRVGKMGQSGKAGPNHKWYVCIAMSLSFPTGDGEPRDQDFLKIILACSK